MADIAILTALSTAVWDESKPSGTRDVNLGDDDIREFKGQVRERMDVDHNTPADETGIDNIGAHKAIHMLVQADKPDSLADAGIIYTKDVEGKAEAHWLDEDDNEIQITSKGVLLLTNALLENARLSNNVTLKAKNAAGSGIVDLIKANASNKPEIPDGAVMATSGAPTVDNGIANKKYVDDKVSAIPSPFSSYDSGWFAVSANSDYSKSHNLGTTKILISLYFSTNADGSGGWQIPSFVEDRGDGNYHGMNVFITDTNTISVSTAAHPGMSRSGGTYDSGYVRVIILKLP